MNTPTKESLLGFTDELLPESAHICLIFDNEEERKSIVSRFLAAGLKRGEQVRYFADVAPPDEIRAWLLEKGVELPDAKEGGPFSIVKAESFYAPEGRFDPRQSIGRMVPRLEQTAKAGYSASRVTGEMSWALKGIPGSDRLLEYESMLTAVNVTFPHFGMCQYDARLFDGATLFKVLQVHPYMVAQGQIVRNPFFVKPEEFAAGTHAS